MSHSPVTLITGGSSGIGAALASRLLERGERVMITGRSKERLDSFTESLGSPDGLFALVADASDWDAVQATIEATEVSFGRLDTVVANAGFAAGGSLAEGEPAEWREMVLTNVLGPALLIRAALPALRRAKGRIVLIGSVAGVVPTKGNFYGATKWAVTGLAENTRRLVSADGVGVTLINPGMVVTPFWEAHGGVPEDVTMLTPGRVADAIVWAMTQPPGVDVNTITVRPPGQAS